MRFTVKILGLLLSLGVLSSCGSSGMTGSGSGVSTPALTSVTLYGPNPAIGVGEVVVRSDGSLVSSNSIAVPGLSASSSILQGIGVDGAGNIYAGLQNFGTNATASVLVFAAGTAGNGTPVRTITGPNTKLFDIVALAVDAAGDVYVSQGGGSDLLEFAAGADGNAAPVRTLKGPFALNTGIGAVLGMGFDSSGNLYLANDAYSNGNNILVFGPTQSGDAAPIRTLGGSATMMVGNVLGIAFDKSDNLYVTTQYLMPTQRTILEFAAGASGNVAPVRAISGSNTMITGNLTNPVVDSSGNVYVLSVLSPTTINVLKFAPDANGNVAPATVTSIGSTTINSFQIALH